MGTEHQTKVVVIGPTGNRAICRCGWTQDCVSAPAAARECWTHVKAHTSGPVEVEAS